MFMVTKTELHNKLSMIDECMKAGVSVVITSRGEAIGMITPEIPAEVRAKIKVKDWSIPFNQCD